MTALLSPAMRLPPHTTSSEIRISYDLSPLSVTNSRRRPSFLHFLVQVHEPKFNCTSNRKLRFSLQPLQLCAIIGGVFTVAGIVESATVPARIVNWSGQEHVAIEEWCGYIGELIGIAPKFEYTDKTLESVMTDNAKMRELVGPAKVTWKDATSCSTRRSTCALLRPASLSG